jgi:hypothetical protein
MQESAVPAACTLQPLGHADEEVGCWLAAGHWYRVFGSPPWTPSEPQ